MKMIKKRHIGIVLLLIILILFILLIFKNQIINKKEKYAWAYVKNTSHEQPVFDREYENILKEYHGIFLGNSLSRNIYLTFDEGYENGCTEKILDVLKENQVKVTFFVTGPYVMKNPELVQRMIDEGHIIGNHTMNHKSMATLSNKEIEQEVMEVHNLVYEKFGYEMKYLRPPMGEFNKESVKYCSLLGYRTVMWSFAYDDWNVDNQGREEYAKNKILNNVHKGGVILLHAVSKDNANVLDDCIKEMRKMGYRFESLDNFK